MARRYTTEQIQFLRTAWPVLTLTELADEFNLRFRTDKTPAQLKGTLNNHKIRNHRGTGRTKGACLAYTPEQLQFIKEKFLVMPMSQVCPLFNEKFNTNKSVKTLLITAKRYGYKSGRSGQFQKGHTPANKGTKGLMKPNSGSFKKGSTPANKKPVGHERIDAKDGYILIRVAGKNPWTGHDGYYMPKHKVIWEQHHGPVPAGKILSFKDGNKLNCVIENLQLLDRGVHAQLAKQGYYTAPDELKPTIKRIVQLSIKAAEKKRQLKRKAA